MTNNEFTYAENVSGALMEVKHDTKDKDELGYNDVQCCCSEVSINESLWQIFCYRPQAEAA